MNHILAISKVFWAIHYEYILDKNYKMTLVGDVTLTSDL